LWHNLYPLQAGAVDPAELAMYAALMTSTNVNMVVSTSGQPVAGIKMMQQLASRSDGTLLAV
jgi:hypothetical protein